ncbi:MAG: glycine cleavage system protein GcvH [Chloroflexi bacterium]|nr:MAG: glycine cleavage system protein GcvH [Chloroflexota bacterium]TMB93021.1 MAG: glycine cleavage system protein GcvH [Chloroflexota bacterium]TMC30858.1 MAG: glycine cleavage system protein GcvH [Chloroflexota bacterium]TMC32940.1 MAG: glycine cleavage system protein GcvH [Chloroflexota bacterium]TMC56189.1 MAG: glycine cleavage system protein GcvH [Chloroflexota bacterium]
MTVPQDLRYSKEHEWVRLEGDTATIGITAFAQEQLGDVVFVELPEKGATVRQFSSLGVVESVKAASDIYSPISGEVIERNMKVIEKPELVNQKPYEEGWMLKVKLADKGELQKLLSADDYRAHIGETAGSGGS